MTDRQEELTTPNVERFRAGFVGPAPIFFLGGTQGRDYRDSENLSENQIGVFKSKNNNKILLVENK